MSNEQAQKKKKISLALQKRVSLNQINIKTRINGNFAKPEKIHNFVLNPSFENGFI